MFDFLVGKRGKEPESIIELITLNATKASIYDIAIGKANGMIAKAIAKANLLYKEMEKEQKMMCIGCSILNLIQMKQRQSFGLKQLRRCLKKMNV